MSAVLKQSTSGIPCRRQAGIIVCGSGKKKKIKMTEARLKEGRRRLADVISDLQSTSTLDAVSLQEQLKEVSQCCSPSLEKLTICLIIYNTNKGSIECSSYMHCF